MLSKKNVQLLAAFGVGVVGGWAITADRSALRYRREMAEILDEALGEFKDALEERDADWSRLLNDKTEQIFALKALVEGPNPADITVEEIRTINQPISEDEIDLEKLQMQVNAEILRQKDADLRELNERVLFGTPTTESEMIGEDSGDISAEEVDNNDFEEEIVFDETVEETRSNLQKLIDSFINVEGASPAEDFDGEMAHGSNALTTATRPPYVITQEDYAFGEDGQYFDKVTITWYPRDRVLLDDADEIIADRDIPKIVGNKSLQSFGHLSMDDDTVFVRNERMETDFEVLRENELPLPTHIRYGMDKTTFDTHRAAGLIKMRPEDE